MASLDCNSEKEAPRNFYISSLVFIRKRDSGMSGPYCVMRKLPHGRYELQHLTDYGKMKRIAADRMIPWYGQWTPEVYAACLDDADSGSSDKSSDEELKLFDLFCYKQLYTGDQLSSIDDWSLGVFGIDREPQAQPSTSKVPMQFFPASPVPLSDEMFHTSGTAEQPIYNDQSTTIRIQTDASMPMLETDLEC